MDDLSNRVFPPVLLVLNMFLLLDVDRAKYPGHGTKQKGLFEF